MKVGIVLESLEMGGMQTVLKSLALFFRSQGHSVDFIEVESRGIWADYFRTLDFQVHAVPERWYVSKYAHAREVARHLSTYDVLLLNDVPVAQASLGLLPPEVIAIPVIHLDMPSFISNAAGNFGQWNRVVTVSAVLKEKFVKSTGIGPEYVEFISNAVDFPEVTSPQPVQETNRLHLLFLGRIENNQKGVFLLPEIMKRAATGPKPLFLHVVGDGPDLGKLKRLFSETGLTNVKFYGSLLHDQALDIMKSSRFLLMPSYFEGMPIALLEAMSQGVVPLVSRLELSTDYIVENEKNGYLVEPGDVDGFAARIVESLEHPERLDRMSYAARDTVKKKFTTRFMGEHYLEVINAARQSGSSLPMRRTNAVKEELLGEYPRIPVGLIRPVRKIMRGLGLRSDGN